MSNELPHLKGSRVLHSSTNLRICLPIISVHTVGVVAILFAIIVLVLNAKCYWQRSLPNCVVALLILQDT